MKVFQVDFIDQNGLGWVLSKPIQKGRKGLSSIDRPYLLRDATIAISDNGGNILVAKSVTSSKRIVNLIFQIEISDNDQLDAIINDAKNIENVFDASRIYPGRK